MMTKTQTRIMENVVSEITEKFSIKKISKTTNKPYPLVHRSIKSLMDEKFITKDKYNFLSLNYKENIMELAYVESLRKKEFIKRNKTAALFAKDVIEKIDLDFFTFLIFGSAVKKRKPRDVDVLFIIENKTKVGNIEKILHNIASNFTLKFDINVISIESAREMLAKRNEPNVLNETLNNHILVFGAENYYRLLRYAG